VAAVRVGLVAWYRRAGRDLPWRRTRDPYAVLIAEMMLQQQRVDRVVPVFRTFLERFPTLAALAAGPRSDALRIWSAIGLNAHALRLYAIACWAMGQNDGRLPETVEGLRALKGIGPYTAGAVVCFAHERPAALVDTNVRRVLGRLFAAEVPTAADDDRLAWRVAEAALPPDGAGAYDWNQALLDLGALVCTARAPRCVVCPVQTWCSWRGWGASPDLSSPALIEGTPALVYGTREISAPGGSAGSTQPPGPTTKRAVAEARATYDAAPGHVAAAPTRETPDAPETPGTRVSGVRGAGREKKKAPRRYEGTRRWARGRTIHALSALPPGTAAALADVARGLKPDYADGDLPWFLEVARSLAKDGLVRLHEAADGAHLIALPED
jgi:A/G-specific adenine glycosylase